jgi:glycosyltransferase involved in cell wall biosynthesis
MTPSILSQRDLSTIVLVGNYLPRRCGIATFTTHLLEALALEANGADCWAVVMNDVPEGYAYPHEVRFEVNHKDPADYRLAADFLNINHVDVVCLQHEFGIFGGRSGANILELIRNLRMPVVTTLHTVLANPSERERLVIEDLARFSDRLVVMSHRAAEILMDVYGVQPERLVHIPHGIPDVPFVDPNFYKDQFGVEGRKVILTFGLLSPGKGIENMIDAMPAVVRRHPDAAYIVLGATHPNVKREHGESYRLSLQRRAKDAGVEDHLIFHNRFVEQQELCEFIGAADIYVTPYVNREQIVSGTLAYALGAGKAAVSTPYYYAEEMLRDGRGRLVPFKDPGALAEQVIDLLDNEVERHAMRKRAYTFCRDMVWKEVARRYLEVFIEVKRERELRPKRTFSMKTLQEARPELPQVKLDHLLRMTDDVGLLQHATYIVPDRFHGYCTDDNARALIVALTAQRYLAAGEELTNLACRYLSFLQHAFNNDNGRFRNFMEYDRRWVEERGSEDSHARAIWALGMATALSNWDGIVSSAVSLFKKALPALAHFQYPRPWAFAIVGIHAYLRRFSGDSEARRIRDVLSEKLLALYRRNASEEWPWIEPQVTYANGKICQALLLSGQWAGDEAIQAGLRSLEWLLKVQTDPKGHFVPIGNHGWFHRNGGRARFDQQPIEAQNMIEACAEAYQVTQDETWIAHARRCFEWFLGKNDLNVSLYDFRTGGCSDGLTADGPSQNQGAESLLAWLIALLRIQMLNESKAVPVDVPLIQ